VDIHPPNPALDALLALVSVLHQRGMMDDMALAMMIERLELSDYGDIADRVAALPFMNMMDPNYPDGGNGTR
jgi:hypothetical protein